MDENSFHNYKAIYQNLVKRFEKDKDLSAYNKKTLSRYKEILFSEGLSQPRINKVFYQTWQLTQMIQKDWNKVNKKDIRDLITKIQKSQYAEETKRDYKVMVKRFFNQLNRKRDRNTGRKTNPKEIKEKNRQVIRF